MVTNQTTQRPNPPVFCLIIQLNILELKKICSTLSSGESSGGWGSSGVFTFCSHPPNSGPQGRDERAPPHLQSTNVSVSPPLPWPCTLENPHGDSNCWCHENPSDLMTALINTLTLILLTTRKVRYWGKFKEVIQGKNFNLFSFMYFFCCFHYQYNYSP